MNCILNPSVVNAYIDLHKEMQLPFTLTMSNYTTRIKSFAYDIKFMKQEQPNRVFAAFAKIKKDCLKKPMPKVKTNRDDYFSEAFMPHDFYSDLLFNFDIKSAYATVLFNEGFISEDTFTYINNLPKQERLACVGMLAGKKNIFHIDHNGEVISEETIISPTSEYFFYCVKRTAELIKGAAKILGEGFVFSWVDGIYFLENPESVNDTAKILIEHYFNEKRFLVTFEKLTEFNVSVKEDYYYCTYRKGDELKIMNVPKKENKAIAKITNHLLKKCK